MNPDPQSEIRFLGMLREFASTVTWLQLRAILDMRHAAHVRASASQVDPMCGRTAARADELLWIMEFVDKAGEREKAIADEMKAQSEAEAAEQISGNGGGEYVAPVATV